VPRLGEFKKENLMLGKRNGVKIKHKQIVEKLSEISSRFSDWELEFISVCYNWSGEYTDKQKEIILRINNKYRKSNG